MMPESFFSRITESQSMASILTPLKKISPDPYIFCLPMTYHLRGISKFFSEAPIKSASPNHPLVKGYIETGQSQE